MSKIMNNIRQYNSKQATILVGSLCLMFLDWNSYGYYVFYLPCFYVLFKGAFRYVDKNFMMLLLFGFSYSVIAYFNYGGISYVYNVLPIINFPMAYLMGRMIADTNIPERQITTLWYFALAMALLTMLSVYVDFIENGFAFVGRDIKLIGYSNENGEFLYTATGLYSKIMLLTLFASFLFFRTNNKKKWLMIITACVAFVCCLRLQSRTAIYVIATSLMIPLLFGSKDFRINKLIGIGFVIAVVSYVLMHYSSELLIIDRFQNNNVFDNEGGESRMDLSIKTLKELQNNPFGGMRSSRYAHNLWIDVARVSGWLPAFILILVTWRWIKITVKVFKLPSVDEYYRLFVVLVSICLLLYFNTEPILEGASMLFTFSCLFYGMISNYSKYLCKK